MSATGCLESVPVQPPVVHYSTSTDSGGVRTPVRAVQLNRNYWIQVNLQNSFVLKNVAWIIKFLEEFLRNLKNSNPQPALPMPESGDIDVLTASQFHRSLGGVAARRRVSLALDLSDYTSEEIISKKSQNLGAVNFRNPKLLEDKKLMKYPNLGAVNFRNPQNAIFKTGHHSVENRKKRKIN